MIGISVSRHALIRGMQRNVTGEDMELVIRFGRMIYSGGALMVFLRQRDIPEDLTRDDRIAKLMGTTLILTKDGETIITVYRNRRALKNIKKMPKWFIPDKEAA